MNAAAFSGSQQPIAKDAIPKLRQVQRALRAARASEATHEAERELARLLEEVLYPLVDAAALVNNSAIESKVIECAAAVAQFCDFERLRPANLPSGHVARIVTERQNFWSAADLKLRELLIDLAY